jgi:hypothetical protein
VQSPNTIGLREYHGFGNGARWRLGRDGVEVEGTGVERTSGAPTTVTRIWEAYTEAINHSASAYGVPCQIIVATIAIESGGHADAIRKAPGYVSDERTPHLVSVGLMHTLLSTARETLRMNLDRDYLLVPGHSIDAGTAYIREQADLTAFDPPLVAAAYNAGGLYDEPGLENRWKVRQSPIGTGIHLDRFVRLFNDSVFVLARHAIPPAVTYEF